MAQIGVDGSISPVYKMCSVSVYAINKSIFNQFYLEDLYAQRKSQENDTVLKDYLSQNAKEVAKGLATSESVSVSDSRSSIINEYNIDLNTLKEKPDNVIVERNYLIYVYIIAPIVALALIILFLIKRRK